MAVKGPGTGSGGRLCVCTRVCFSTWGLQCARELPLTDLTDKAAHSVVILGKIQVFQPHFHFCTDTSI